MASKAKSSKAGRNKVKCAAYRQKKGGDGSKRPKGLGNRTIAKPIGHSVTTIPKSAPKERTIEVGIVKLRTENGPSGFVAAVPASWVR